MAATVTSQHMDALNRANTVRSAAALLKRRLAAGELTLQQALTSPDAGPIPVGRLLEALPRYGVHKTEAVLKQVQVSAHRRVRDLTPRQRALIVEIAADGRRRRPRTDVEPVAWWLSDEYGGSSNTPTHRHLWTIDGLTLCGRRVPHTRIASPDTARTPCRTCHKAARWDT